MGAKKLSIHRHFNDFGKKQKKVPFVDGLPSQMQQG